MKAQKLILIGGGGHCKSVIEAIQFNENIELTGILDPVAKGSIMGIPVIGDDSLLESLIASGHHFLITVGQIGSPALRQELYKKVKHLKGRLVTLVTDSAVAADSANIGEGTCVMQHSLINAEAVIGSNCIINTKALIEHEVRIGDHTHVSTGAIINGQCRIGSGCFIGSGAVIANNVTIANDVIIGAGSVIMKDITEAGTWFGNPAGKQK